MHQKTNPGAGGTARGAPDKLSARTKFTNNSVAPQAAPADAATPGNVFPGIERIEIIDDGKRKLYRVSLCDASTVIVAAHQLCTYHAFMTACIEQISRCFAPIRKKEWRWLIDAALQKAVQT